MAAAPGTPFAEDFRGCLAETPRTVSTASGPIEYADRGRGEPVLSVHGTFGGWDQGLVAAEFLRVNGYRIHRSEQARISGNAAVDGADLHATGRCHGRAARCAGDRPHHRARRLRRRTRGLRTGGSARRPCIPARSGRRCVHSGPDSGGSSAPLHRVTCPTLIVHGRSDKTVPPANAEYAHAHISGSELYWMDGSHVAFALEAADTAPAYVVRWLRGSTGAAQPERRVTPRS